MPSILTLDLGTTTGWALYDLMDGTMRPASGSVCVKGSRFDGGGVRYLNFRNWLTDIKNTCEDKEICHVYYEAVRRHIGVDAAHAYGGYMATLQAWCEHHKIPYEGVPVATIKKHATGKGNASKDDMIAAMKDKGHNPKDDNESDALAIMYWALDNMGGQ